MGKKVFTVGDLVFAKVKGYPAWPARVTGRTSGGKYCVFFYGTFEVGNMKPEEMWPYNQKFRERFGPANMRKKWYSEGLYHIEHTPEIAFQQVGPDGDGGDVQDNGVQENGAPDRATEPVLVKVLSNSQLKEIYVKTDHLHDSLDQPQSSTKLECKLGYVKKILQAGDSTLDNEVRQELEEKLEMALKERILVKKKEKLEWLKTEQRLVNIVWQIQKSMCNPTPDLAKCVEMLELMVDVDIKPLMVIKLPEVFMTVRKLSMEWVEGSGGCLTEQVREKSERVRVKIVQAFNLDTAISLEEFNEHFEKKVSEFKKKTSGLTDRERLSLINLEEI